MQNKKKQTDQHIDETIYHSDDDLTSNQNYQSSFYEELSQKLNKRIKDLNQYLNVFFEQNQKQQINWLKKMVKTTKYDNEIDIPIEKINLFTCDTIIQFYQFLDKLNLLKPFLKSMNTQRDKTDDFANKIFLQSLEKNKDYNEIKNRVKQILDQHKYDFNSFKEKLKIIFPKQYADTKHKQKQNRKKNDLREKDSEISSNKEPQFILNESTYQTDQTSTFHTNQQNIIKNDHKCQPQQKNMDTLKQSNINSKRKFQYEDQNKNVNSSFDNSVSECNQKIFYSNQAVSKRPQQTLNDDRDEDINKVYQLNQQPLEKNKIQVTNQQQFSLHKSKMNNQEMKIQNPHCYCELFMKNEIESLESILNIKKGLLEKRKENIQNLKNQIKDFIEKSVKNFQENNKSLHSCNEKYTKNLFELNKQNNKKLQQTNNKISQENQQYQQQQQQFSYQLQFQNQQHQAQQQQQQKQNQQQLQNHQQQQNQIPAYVQQNQNQNQNQQGKNSKLQNNQLRKQDHFLLQRDDHV